MYLRTLQLLALIALCGLAPAAFAQRTQPQIAIGHFSPALGELAIELDGVSQGRVNYSGYLPWRPLNSGERHIVARNAQGQIVAQTRFTALTEDSLTVFVAGMGTDDAPFELLVVLDTVRPALQGSIVQEINLALPQGNPNTPVRAERDLCLNAGFDPDTVAAPDRLLHYRHGTLNLTRPRWDAPPVSVYSSRPESCRYRVWTLDRQPLSVSEPLNGAPGSRIQIVMAGDGRLQPIRAHMIVQEIAPLPVLAPSADLEGLWFMPARPGWLVLVAYEPPTAALRSGEMRAYLLANNADAKATWLRLRDRGNVLEVAGGAPDHTGATFDDLAGLSDLVFHSSSHATWIQNMPADGNRSGWVSVSEPLPEKLGSHAVTLIKLLPRSNAGSSGL